MAGDADDEADSERANGKLDRLARTFSRRLLLRGTGAWREGGKA